MQPQAVELAKHQKGVLENEKRIAVRLHDKVAVKDAVGDRSASQKTCFESMLLPEAF